MPVPSPPIGDLASAVAGSSAGALQFTCKQCNEKCMLAGSKPAGTDPRFRLELKCALNRRNMEKRVARRPNPEDPLRKFWQAVVADREKLAAWSRKMKKRGVYQHEEINMQVVEEEIKSFNNEQRLHEEYYGFATIVEDFPLHDEAEHLKIWQSRVANAQHKIEVGGQLFISKAPKLHLDQVQSNGFQVRGQRAHAVEDGARLETCMATSRAHLDRFKSLMHQDGHKITPQTAPVEAEISDDLVGNITSPAKRALECGTLEALTIRDMTQQAQEQAEIDKEMMEDISVRQSSPVVTKPVDLRSIKGNFEAKMVERRAKLEASAITLRQEVSGIEAPNLDHIAEGASREEATQEYETLMTQCQQKLQIYNDKVAAFDQKFKNTDPLFDGATDRASVDKVIDDADREYKEFFGRASHQQGFRESMKKLKEKRLALRKEAEKILKAQTLRSSVKRKTLEVDEHERLPPLAEAMKDDLGKSEDAKLNFGIAAEFPKKPVLLDGHPGLDAFGTIPQALSMMRWRAAQVKKEGSDITAQVLNKQLLNRLTACFKTKLDSKFEPGNFNLAMDADSADLVETLKSYQFTHMDAHFDINITPFGFSEVRAVFSGGYACFLLPLDKVPGEDIVAKKATVASWTKAVLLETVKDHGASAMVGTGNVICIPSGWMVIDLAVSATSLFRWSLYDRNTDKVSVRSVLDSMLQAYPLLEGTDYKRVRAAVV